MKKVLVFCMILVMLAVNVFADDTATIKLNTWERVRIKEFLPKRSTFEKSIMANDIKKKVKFSQEEFEEFEIKTTSAGTTWNEKGLVGKEYKFSYLELEMFKAGLEKKSNDKQIEASDPFLELCKKIRAAKIEKDTE